MGEPKWVPDFSADFARSGIFDEGSARSRAASPPVPNGPDAPDSGVAAPDSRLVGRQALLEIDTAVERVYFALAGLIASADFCSESIALASS